MGYEIEQQKTGQPEDSEKKPKLTAKPLRGLGGEVLRNLPDKYDPTTNKLRTEVAGIPIPPDLEQAISYYSRSRVSWLIERLSYGEYVPWGPGPDDYDVVYEPLEMDQGHVDEILREMQEGMREAFYLALLRYSNELEQAPEAAAILLGMGRGRKKGGAANRKKAEPSRSASRKRFRELRKSGFTKGDARKVLEQETGKSFRQIERDTRGLS